MNDFNEIPVIDLFAGPGGLSEGFSSVYENNKKVYSIKLSIEKDKNAHKTLLLRSFFRQFEKDQVPENYYNVLRSTSIKTREENLKSLYSNFPDEYEKAAKEVWNAELGSQKYPPELIDERILENLKGSNDWVLIGGPPCQAYSLVGRSRVGGIKREDHRVYLYKEYLRIIAKFHPSVFVMENVKGLLSAKINGNRVFSWILRDLQNPSATFHNINSPNYKIYSFTKETEFYSGNEYPIYPEGKDYLIESEKYGIPQKRHRVILLGIREDINIIPEVLTKNSNSLNLENVIGDLPKIRSGLNRRFIRSEMLNGKKKRFYEKVINSNDNWMELINSYRNEVISWNGFAKDYDNRNIESPLNGIGSEFIKCNSPDKSNPLGEWYGDQNLQGVCNHQSRSHLIQDLKRYMFSSIFTNINKRFPRLHEYNKHSTKLLPDHKSAESGKFMDRFRVQLPNEPATTITSHISKDGHYFIHYDPHQCRSLTVREAARIQTFPDNYLFCGSRTSQYHQVGNAVPPYLAKLIAEIVLKIFIEYKKGSVCV